jgi:hypothetical protein
MKKVSGFVPVKHVDYLCLDVRAFRRSNKVGGTLNATLEIRDSKKKFHTARVFRATGASSCISAYET